LTDKHRNKQTNTKILLKTSTSLRYAMLMENKCLWSLQCVAWNCCRLVSSDMVSSEHQYGAIY